AIFGDRVSPSLKKGFLADKMVGVHGSRRLDTRKISGEVFSMLIDVPKEFLETKMGAGDEESPLSTKEETAQGVAVPEQREAEG
ncbi:hypothetical protein, partial [Actinobacillus pleuropneumoniae]|uniref:hypothetical protein n=1 Tax=Actinobacillus pleuropneumoniae TaxID=715 RepID=UPI00227B71C6